MEEESSLDDCLLVRQPLPSTEIVCPSPNLASSSTDRLTVPMTSSVSSSSSSANSADDCCSQEARLTNGHHEGAVTFNAHGAKYKCCCNCIHVRWLAMVATLMFTANVLITGYEMCATLMKLE